MIERIVPLVALAVLATGGAAQTNPQPAKPAQQSQPIPRSVFLSSMDAEFRKMDLDRDGIVTRREIEQAQIPVIIRQYQIRRNQLFARLDTDRNGLLSPAEFQRLPMNEPAPNAAPMLQRLDGNRDGKITLVEYRAGTLVNFDRLDADKDGVVTPAELKAGGIKPR